MCGEKCCKCKPNTSNEKYPDADCKLSYILNKSEISKQIDGINSYYQKKYEWWMWLILAGVVLVPAVMFRFARKQQDTVTVICAAIAIVLYVIIGIYHKKVQLSDRYKILELNHQIFEYFNMNGKDCDYLSYILDQRVKGKDGLNSQWLSIVGEFFAIFGVAGLISNAIKEGSFPYFIVVGIAMGLFILVYLIHSIPFGEYLSYSTWKLLAEDAHLAEIENSKNKDSNVTNSDLAN